MEIPPPHNEIYTVYGKSGCVYCTKAKEILKYNKIDFQEVNCDEYLLDNKLAFLETMRKWTVKEHRTFPMVFYGGEFLGGYVEMKQHYDTHFVPQVVSTNLKFNSAF